MVTSVLITGANAGLGKESARQFALLDGVEKVYLGCRNPERAEIAKAELERSTGKSVFEIVILDVSNLDSVRAAVSGLKSPVDALIMNAGGMGGPTPGALTPQGATHMFATNVLGHAVLLEELLTAGKLTKVAMFAGSEAARGIKKMGMKRPALKTSSVDEFASIIDGSYFGGNADPMISYGPAKYVGALWMSSLARKYPAVRFVTMSPGATTGTSAADSMAGPMRFIMTYVAMPMMGLFGMAHGLQIGATRYVEAVRDEAYKSGVFYASPDGKTSGAVVDQATIFSDLGNPAFQDNAAEAIGRFIN